MQWTMDNLLYIGGYYRSESGNLASRLWLSQGHNAWTRDPAGALAQMTPLY